MSWWKGRAARTKADAAQESADLARKRLVSERLMTAAALHRHTPEGYAGASRREVQASSDAANPGEAKFEVAKSEAVHSDVLNSAAGSEAARAAIVDAGSNAGAGAQAVPAPIASAPSAAEASLALRGLPPEILALDLNLDDSNVDLSIDDAEAPHGTDSADSIHDADAVPDKDASHSHRTPRVDD